MPSPRRKQTVIRTVSIVAIVAVPLVSAWADLRAHPPDRYPDAGDEALAAYLEARNPIIEQLLPLGAGGLRLYADLDTASGRAFLQHAAIGIVAGAALYGEGTSIEVHERAHLLYANRTEIVDAILARLPAPEPTQYAATSAHEHVAEMAAMAWDVLVPPENVCLALSPTEFLTVFDKAVPGTAGFVARFLEHGAFATRPDRDSLRRIADSLSAPLAAEWRQLWAEIDAQRDSTGALRPWPRPTLYTVVRAHQKAFAESRHVVERAAAWLMLPSVGLARLIAM